MGRALDFVLAEPWAIQPESLEQILAIAQRHNEMPLDALAAKIGRPLDNTRSVEMRGNVAVIPVHGPIFRYANLFTAISGATSLEVLASDFNAAIEDRAVARVVLDIDSPGGQANGISEFAEMIRAAGKPVAAYVGGSGNSAAYWLAAAAKLVVISDTAILGSIGVVGTFRPSAKDEIKIISSQSPLKQATPETEEGRAEAQRIVDDLADVFIGAIGNYRGVSRETVLSDFGRGGLLVGEKAVDAKMADQTGSLESVIAGDSGAHSQEGFKMADTKPNAPEITRAYLAEHHPAIVQAIENDAMDLGKAEGLKQGRAEGATGERERIQSVLAQSMPGHDKLIQGMAFDGKTAGPEAAVAVLAAEKESRAKYLKKVATATPVPVEGASDGGEQGTQEDTFESLVDAEMTAGKTKGQAIHVVANDHPELHKQWLARINKATG